MELPTPIQDITRVKLKTVHLTAEVNTEIDRICKAENRKKAALVNEILFNFLFPAKSYGLSCITPNITSETAREIFAELDKISIPIPQTDEAEKKLLDTIENDKAEDYRFLKGFENLKKKFLEGK